MRATAFVMALVAVASGCGGNATGDADAPAAESTKPGPTIRAEPPHPPASGSPIRFLRSRQAASSENSRLTEAARAVLPTDVEVWCWQEPVWAEAERRLAVELGEDEVDFAGFADFYSHQIHLDGWVCDELAVDLRTRSEIDDLLQAEALGVFTHETRHFSLSGSDEAATECVAIQRMDEMGESLGASARYADELKRLVWEEVYPVLPPEYRSPHCRAGGILDREPETPEFP